MNQLTPPTLTNDTLTSEAQQLYSDYVNNRISAEDYLERNLLMIVVNCRLWYGPLAWPVATQALQTYQADRAAGRVSRDEALGKLNGIYLQAFRRVMDDNIHRRDTCLNASLYFRAKEQRPDLTMIERHTAFLSRHIDRLPEDLRNALATQEADHEDARYEQRSARPRREG